VGPRTGLGEVERRKILSPPGLELRHLGRPARRQSLYRLHYPGSQPSEVNAIFNFVKIYIFFPDFVIEHRGRRLIFGHKNSVALVRERTIPTAACWRSSANFCG
jgi:hypothetical protein